MPPRAAASTPFLLRMLRRLALVEPAEARSVVLSAAYFFFVLSSYYVIRPIRDEMGVLGGIENIAWLFTGTLVAMLLVHPLFTALVSRTRRARFIPIAYRFFALNLVLFFVALRVLDPDQQVWIGRVFFIWTSVFNLFVVSIFWAFMADLWHTEQGKRLFGFIGVGGTIGAITGSGLTTFLAAPLGPVNLLLVSALLLEVAVWIVLALSRHAGRLEAVAREEERARDVGAHPAPLPVTGAAAPAAAASSRENEVIGGGVWDGLRHVARSPYLLNICLFLLFFTVGSTFLYIMQADVFSRYTDDSAQRTALFGAVDLAVNVLTLTFQLFLTGRLLKLVGLGAGLAMVPVISVVGFATLGIVPVIGAVVLFQVARRAANYGVTRPSREVLFTAVPREDKYKAKNFIDTFVYRFGDQVGAWSYTGLAALGLGLGGLAFAAVPLSIAWVANALWLARRHERRAAEARRQEEPAAA